MKVLGIVLAVLMLSLSTLVGLLGSSKSFELGGQIAEVTEGLTDQQKEAIASELPSVGRLEAGGVLSALGGLAAVALLVFTFVKKPLVTGAAAATVALCALAILVYPTVPTGPMDGMAPRTQAMVAAAMALLGAGGALLARRGQA